MRIAVASAFLFAGALLVYAAVTGGGKYALSPWSALAD